MQEGERELPSAVVRTSDTLLSQLISFRERTVSGVKVKVKVKVKAKVKVKVKVKVNV